MLDDQRKDVIYHIAYQLAVRLENQDRHTISRILIGLVKMLDDDQLDALEFAASLLEKTEEKK